MMSTCVDCKKDYPKRLLYSDSRCIECEVRYQSERIAELEAIETEYFDMVGDSNLEIVSLKKRIAELEAQVAEKQRQCDEWIVSIQQYSTSWRKVIDLAISEGVLQHVGVPKEG